MQFSHYKVYDRKPMKRLQPFLQQLGCACYFASRLQFQSVRLESYIQNTLVPAVNHHQLKIFFDDDDMIVGYVVWATLVEDVESRFIKDMNFNLDDSEWDEGESLWILDMVVESGRLKYALQYLRDELFVDYNRVRYIHRRGSQAIIRELSRDDKVSFFNDT